MSGLVAQVLAGGKLSASATLRAPPEPARPGRPRRGRRRTQHPALQDPRLEDPRRGPQRTATLDPTRRVATTLEPGGRDGSVLPIGLAKRARVQPRFHRNRSTRSLRPRLCRGEGAGGARVLVAVA